MYLSEVSIRNFRQFGGQDSALTVKFNKGVTALVGENDSGKTAVIDAIRYVLLARGMDYVRLQSEDFHIGTDGQQASDITICCKLSDLQVGEKGAFAEYLTYEPGEPALYVHWHARRISEFPGSRRWVDIAVRSGPDGSGPTLDSTMRQLLATAYLRPLRDAEREMSPGRGSRLSQVLNNFPEISKGVPFDKTAPPASPAEVAQLSLAGLSQYLRHLVAQHSAVEDAQKAINSDYLKHLSLTGESLSGRINFADAGSDAARLRLILERLQLDLLEGEEGKQRGSFGLGSNNILFMACELLLLGNEPDGLPLLLIEEPEAHLHPQRQLRLMQFLEVAASASGQSSSRRPVQVIVTTHSPNLSSKIKLGNIVILHRQRAFPLAAGFTSLSTSDYRFLERFLDVTKANLFFARGLLVVEGDAESILFPAIARMIGRDLTENGVSIVNVGSTGLRRYARILQRSRPELGTLEIPVACVADMDVMPDCAPVILGLVESDDDQKWKSPKRKWRAKKHFGDTSDAQETGLTKRRDELREGDGQNVRTFIADEWTLEYDLAYSGLAEEVYISAYLAINDDALNKGAKKQQELVAEAILAYADLLVTCAGDKEVACSHVYAMFGRASKAIAAQYLIEVLAMKETEGTADATWLQDRLPSYVKEAIAYATTSLSGALKIEQGVASV